MLRPLAEIEAIASTDRRLRRTRRQEILREARGRWLRQAWAPGRP